MVEQLWSIKKYLCAFHSTKWEKGANANWHGCLFCSLASRVSICQWKWAMSNFSKHTLGSINNKYGIGKYFSTSSHSKHNYNCKLSRLSVKVFFFLCYFPVCKICTRALIQLYDISYTPFTGTCILLVSFLLWIFILLLIIVNAFWENVSEQIPLSTIFYTFKKRYIDAISEQFVKQRYWRSKKCTL